MPLTLRGAWLSREIKCIAPLLLMFFELGIQRLEALAKVITPHLLMIQCRQFNSKSGQNCQSLMINFQKVAKNIEGFYYFILFYFFLPSYLWWRQIWLNYFSGWSPLWLHHKILKNKGVCHHNVALPFHIKMYLNAKEDLWKLKYFTMQKYNLKKKIL
jgi:hypothetical protein